jgi:hypothetical protein
MRIFGYLGISFLIVSMLLVGTKAFSADASMVIAVADMAQVLAPDATQSEEFEDLLNILD